MTRVGLDAHPTNTIIYGKESGDFLFSLYDDTYPQVPYRLSANLIGGNPNDRDTSPLTTWRREMAEEFDPTPDQKNLRFDKNELAAPEVIGEVRDALLAVERTRDIRYADFFVNGIGFPRNVATPYTAIFSVVEAGLDERYFEQMRRALADGRRIMSEGRAVIYSLNSLLERDRSVGSDGPYVVAHGVPIILPVYLREQKGLDEVTFKGPQGLSGRTLLGGVRDSYDSYLDEFSYNRFPEDHPKAGREKFRTY
ncbi:MAG TPA: hypothetical protein VJK51_01350 [Candidatus Nanoarchaeia archaeon]|nr:hypothetical protein [Candidatus Nanoarchaeia archaeon]